MGDESGGGGGPSGSSTRGQVGLTKKEQNQRAVAQEKGGRQSAGVARGSMATGSSASARSSGNYGAMSPEDVANESMDRSVDQFTTSTTGAYRDLDDRVNKGQISERVQNLPSLLGVAATGLNKLGKYTAGKIRSGIDAGGTAVYDSTGRIQGVVETKDTPFGRSEVYTGGTSYDPTGLGKKATYGVAGRGIVMGAKDVQASERLAGGGDGGGGSVPTAATATNVTGSTTQLSTAAKRKSVQALGAGGASVASRQFLS